MLSSFYRQAYQDFLDALISFQDSLNLPSLAPSERQRIFFLLQQLFQQRVMPLTSEGVNLTIVSRWQSVQTEMHRTMRLLQTDLLRWQASRQAETSKQRQTEVETRVEQLIQYCNALLSEKIE